MSSIVISGDTSGTVSLTVPTVAGTNTATLPAATGTVMVSGNMPAFSVYRSSSEQSVTSGVATKIQFNVEEFDTANAFDSTTNYRFTPQVAGYYLLTGAMTSNGTTITQSTITIYKNGTEYKRLQYSANNAQISGSAIVYLNGSTDYIEFYGIVTAVSGSTFYFGQPYTFATGSLVRGA